MQTFGGNMPDANPAASNLCEPARSTCTWTCHKRHFTRKCLRKMPCAYPVTQAKCTWTCHKRHVVRKLTGKMPNASDTTSIKHRLLTVTVRTPQCGHTAWQCGHTAWQKIVKTKINTSFRQALAMVPGLQVGA